jgi:tetratricopeptide (TPR) repeat protein
MPALLTRILLCGVLAVGVLSPGVASRPDLSVQFEVKDGDTIGDLKTIVAKVAIDENAGVEKVEFFIDDKIVGSDTSTPYTYDWDTLETTEGAHTISVNVVDSKNRTAKAKISVKVDNELAKGADFHGKNAIQSLKDGNLDEARRFARRAIKIEPTNIPGARVLAGLLGREGLWDKAIETLEAAKAPATDIEANSELVGLYMSKASKADSTEDFVTQGGKAVLVQRTVNAAVRQAVNKTGDAVKDAIALGDAYFAERDFNSAVREYQKAGEAETMPMEAANRLLLAYIRGGRYSLADNFYKSIERYKRTDEITHAVRALMLYNAYRYDEARKLVDEGVKTGVLSSVIIAAFSELVAANTKGAKELSDTAFAAAPRDPLVLLLQSYTITDPIDSERILYKAIAADPLQSEPYVARGFRTIMGRDSDKYKAGDTQFDFAQKMDKTSNFAKIAGALSLMGQKRPNEAEPLLAQVAASEVNAGDVHVVIAANENLLNRPAKINYELEKARMLDPKRWGEAALPKIDDLIKKIYQIRYPISLTPAQLYPKAQ